MADDDPRLEPLPERFEATRDALHQLAFYVLAPRRFDNVGRLGLRATPGGFGTGWFDGPHGRERVRMAGATLVVDVARDGDEDAGVDHERELQPSTIAEACAFVGMEHRTVWFEDFHDPLEPWDPDRPLQLDETAARTLGDWFAFGTAALEELRATPNAVDPSPVQLWPEHFDPATELGSTEDGTRASYGASPGDADHDQPYLYVAPWTGHANDAFWSDDAFDGASMSYAELLGVEDPLAAAVAFLRRGYGLLTDPTS